MGKHSRRKCTSVPFEKSHSGGMWSILHTLNFYQWHNVKKMLPGRRQSGGRHATGLNNMGLDVSIPDTGEEQKLMDVEVDNFLIEGEMTDASLKISGKARMKVLIAEEMSKEEDSIPPKAVFSARTRLERTDSLHLELSDHDHLDGMKSNGENKKTDLFQENTSTLTTFTRNSLLMKAPKKSVPCDERCEVCGTMDTMNFGGHDHLDKLGRQLLEKHALFQDKLDKIKEALLAQNPMDPKDLSEDDPLLQSKEFLDALEIFNSNTELFLKILRGRDSYRANHSQGLQASNAKIGLNRAGSFPLTGPLGRTNVRLHKQKYKPEEEGSFTKEEGIMKSSEDISDQPMKLIADDNEVSDIKHNHESPEISEIDRSLDSSLGTQNLKNQVVISRFEGIKQRIKHAIRGSRKEHRRISMDAILHRIPYGRWFFKDVKKEMSNPLKEDEVNKDDKDCPSSSYESDSTVTVLRKGGLQRIRRTPSLGESLERYSRLFESSFSGEVKSRQYDKLKLKNEDRGSLGECAPKALSRIFSLPELESHSSLLSEVSRDNLRVGSLNRVHVESKKNIEFFKSDQELRLGLPISTDNFTELDAYEASGSQEKLLEVSESTKNDGDQVGLALDPNDGGDVLNNLTIGNSSFSSHPEVVEPAINSIIKLAQTSPITDFAPCFQEDVTSSSKCSIPEGLELKSPQWVHFDELDSLVDLQEQTNMDTPSGTGSRTDLANLQILNNHFLGDLLHVRVDKKDEPEFNYVQNVLKLSGFYRNEFLRSWHSPDQPVDPSLFDEVEHCSGHKLGGRCDHELLFYLINEVLMEIHERSFTYFPKPLSLLNSHICPMPVGYCVLEQVWSSISWYLSSQRSPHQSLDYIVDRDFAKGDGWMNLQFDAECVVLEMEELILEDLLEEVFCSSL